MTKSRIKETPPRWKSVLDKARGDFKRAKDLVVADRLRVASAAVLKLCPYADGSDEGPWDATAGDGATAEDLLDIAQESLFMQPLGKMEKLTDAADAALLRMRLWHEAFSATPASTCYFNEFRRLKKIVDKCSARLAERRALMHVKNQQTLMGEPLLLRRAMTAARDSMEGNEEFSGHLLRVINEKFPPEAPPEHKEHAKRAKASPRASTPRSGKKRKA